MATTIAPATKVSADGSGAVAPAVTPTTTQASSIADPAPLGLAAFALTTALLSATNAGKITSGALVFVALALVYGGVAQFAAGMWEFRKGNTFGATAFTSYAAFWISLGLLELLVTLNKSAGAFFGADASIWLLFLWAVFTTYMWITSFRTNLALVITFTLLTAAFWALYIGALHGDAAGKGFTAVGGWLGLATAAAAFYTSFAGVINSTYGFTVLPTFPFTGQHPAAPAAH